jgi:hypothetical protein
VSGQLHTPAALPPLPIGQNAGWTPKPSRCPEEEKISCPCWESNLSRPAPSPPLSQSNWVKSSLAEITSYFMWRQSHYFSAQQFFNLLGVWYNQFHAIMINQNMNACYKLCNTHLYLPEDPCNQWRLQGFTKQCMCLLSLLVNDGTKKAFLDSSCLRLSDEKATTNMTLMIMAFLYNASSSLDRHQSTGTPQQDEARRYHS